jgi:hypothetical protein
MICRRHGTKPTLALWTLVVVALLAAATGPLVTVVLLAVVATAAVGFAGSRLLAGRENTQVTALIARRRA